MLCSKQVSMITHTTEDKSSKQTRYTIREEETQRMHFPFRFVVDLIKHDQKVTN